MINHIQEIIKGVELETNDTSYLCPICNGGSYKVIEYGLPVFLCCDESCNCVHGFWANITNLLPFNGLFMQYHGKYIPALWNWLKGSKY